MEYCKLALVLHRSTDCNQPKPSMAPYVVDNYMFNNMAHILLSFLLIMAIVSTA